jgi:uncharacterized protein YaiI (UPF0178 family)
VLRVARRHALQVYMVSNQWMRTAYEPAVHRIVAPEGPDAADDWIVAHIGANDIAVTRDIELAARCLEKGAKAIGPSGLPFTGDNIGMAAAMRDLTRHLRETGEIKGSHPSHMPRDRSRFLQALEEAIQSIRRRAQSLSP